MQLGVSFYSYFKDLAGGARATVALPEGGTIGDLLREVARQFPRFAPMQNSALVAVGVEYQPKEYVLKPGDEVALFPPVQGG